MTTQKIKKWKNVLSFFTMLVIVYIFIVYGLWKNSGYCLIFCCKFRLIGV